MVNFNEHALEMSIMQLFKDEGYTYVSGEQIHSERTEVGYNGSVFETKYKSLQNQHSN